jgi:cyclopropane fatty-acyl-phospholipid synthase-like methyltransferase
MSTNEPPVWDQRYATENYLFGERPNRFLASQASRLKRGQSALALADGEARNGVWLAEQGLEVLSVDASAVAQEKARRLARSRGVRIKLELADLAHWQFPQESFDVVAAIFFQFAGPALRAELFDGIKRALKPGGLLLLEGYRPKQLDYRTGGPPIIENLYTGEMLREAFSDD